MTTLDAARELAGRSAWLAGAEPRFRRAVLERCVLQHFEPQQVIYAVGDGPGGIHCLVSGSVRVSLASAESGPFFGHLMRPGTWIGEGPLITRQPRLVGLSAGRRSEVLLLPLPAIQSLLETYPAGWQAIAMLTFVNLQTAVMALNDLMIRDDTKRLVATLLRLSGHRFVSPAESEPIALDLSQEDLGTMANLARSTTLAILHRLAEAELIRLDYRHIVVLEPERLRRMLKKD